MLKLSHDSAPQTRRKMRSRVVPAALCVIGSLATQGCLFQKKKVRVFQPPVMVVKVVPQVVSIPTADITPPLELALEVDPRTELSEPYFPAPPPARVATPAPTKPAPPKVSATPEVAPPAAPQTPRAIITAEERNRMDTEVRDRLEHVRTVLKRAEGRNLSAELVALVNNTRTLAEQAEQERQRDLPTAVSLATRADRFATDLSARLP